MSKKKPRKHIIRFPVSSAMWGADVKMNKLTGEIYVQSKCGDIVHPAGLMLEYFYKSTNKVRYLSRLVVGPISYI